MKAIKVIIQILIVFVPLALNMCAFLPIIILDEVNHLFYFWTATLTAVMAIVLGHFSLLFGEWFDSKLKQDEKES